MHCKTIEEFKDFISVLKTQDLFRAMCYSDDVWNTYEEQTCVRLDAIGYGTVDYFSDGSYTILEWRDFMKDGFTKEDLKPGDILITKSKGMYMYIGDYIVRSNGWIATEEYDENLKLKHRGLKEIDSFDIVKVLRPKDYTVLEHNWEYADLIWEREEVEIEEMTLEEVCKALGKEIKIVKSK